MESGNTDPKSIAALARTCRDLCELIDEVRAAFLRLHWYHVIYGWAAHAVVFDALTCDCAASVPPLDISCIAA